MAKIIANLKKWFNVILGIFQGRGVSSIDRAERKKQIDERDKTDKEAGIAVENGDIDALNEILGWGSDD